MSYPRIPDVFIFFSQQLNFLGHPKALHSGSRGVQLRWNCWLRFDAVSYLSVYIL